MRRIILLSALFAGVMALGPFAATADACPMCKYANESEQASEAENARPKAYMYSILFMLAMPATIFTGFSVGFYRLWRQQQEINDVVELTTEDREP